LTTTAVIDEADPEEAVRLAYISVGIAFLADEQRRDGQCPVADRVRAFLVAGCTGDAESATATGGGGRSGATSAFTLRDVGDD